MPTLTLDLTPEQAARVQDALTSHLNLPDGQSATMLDAREAVVNYLKSVVRQHERRAALESAEAGLQDLGDIA